jgi:hypothetical protein
VGCSRGSAALVAAYDGIRRTLGPTVTPSVARRFVALMGSDITDQLEGLPQNDKKELVVGAGDTGVTSIATVNLGTLLAMLARDMNVSTGDVMKMLKLPYSGLDMESVKRGGPGPRPR